MTMAEHRMTRRSYLTLKTMMDRDLELPRNANPLAFQTFAGNMSLVIEAVASTAIEHPEWDMDEERTFAEWEKV